MGRCRRIFKITPAANFPPSEFGQKAAAVFQKGVDINTALSQAEEELNKAIEQAKN